MVIKLIKDKEIWDRFIDQSYDSLLFHKWDFLKIMEKYTNSELLSYGIYKGDALICAFPLFFKTYKGLKMIFSPPPRTGVNRLGFVMSREFATLNQNKKENYLTTVAGDFDQEIKKLSPNYVHIILIPNFLDVRPFRLNHGYTTDALYAYAFDLDLSLDEIWNGFGKSSRSDIKKTDSLGLKLLKGGDISTFYELMSGRYDDKCLNFSLRKNYIEELFKTYPDNLELYCLYDNDDNIVGGTINCKYKDTFWLWLGGMKTQKKAYYNEYMIWELIKIAKNEGYKKVDWGGGPQKVTQFKSRFNPNLEIYFTIHKKDNFGKFAEWMFLSFIKKIDDVW